MKLCSICLGQFLVLSYVPGQNGNNMLNRMQNMGPPGLNNIPQAIPISLAQQLNITRMQRPAIQRPIIPRMSGNSLGLNQQQQQVRKIGIF